MKKVLRIFLLISIVTLFNACDKKMHGTITDNFNKPVENVEISIRNSGYIAQSNRNGEFKIDYSPGRINLDFQKDGYVPIQNEVELSEKRKHPLGEIKMIRVPDSTGIYVKGNNDFIKIPQRRMSFKEERNTRGYSAYLQRNFSISPDSVKIIKIDNIKEVDIYDNNGITLHLVEADNYEVAKHRRGLGFLAYQLNDVLGKQIDESKINVGLSTNVRSFKPEINTTYVYINFWEHDMSEIRMSNIAYAFRFELNE